MPDILDDGDVPADLLDTSWYPEMLSAWISNVYEIGAQSADYEALKAGFRKKELLYSKRKESGGAAGGPPVPPGPPTINPPPTGSDTPVPPPEEHGFIPVDALQYAQERAAMLGKWPRDMDDAVRTIISGAVENGWSIPRTVEELRSIFTDFSDQRLETIARTETISAFNGGRVAQFLRQGKFIAGVQWMAVLDNRTTDICTSRNGRIQVMGPGIEVAPAHFNCRSIVSPITALEWKRLEKHDPAAEQRAFGWLKSGPKNLEEALDWSAVVPRQSGF